MPKSRAHQHRRQKLRKRKEKFDALIGKRVKAFNALPEEDKVALLTRWKQFSNKALHSGAGKEEFPPELPGEGETWTLPSS